MRNASTELLGENVVETDPYNLRLTRSDTICLSGARIPPGLVGHCHETPISAELLARQAPELAAIQQLLQELRRRTGLLATFEAVEKYRRWADGWIGPSLFLEADLPDAEKGEAGEPPQRQPPQREESREH